MRRLRCRSTSRTAPTSRPSASSNGWAPASTTGRARLEDHALSFAKLGKDGSGKACFEPATGKTLWGALYVLSAEQFDVLDRFEGGYRRVTISVRRDDHALSSAITYQAERFTDDPVPFDWYKQLIVEGARAHGLPPEWLETLAAIPARAAGRTGASGPSGAR